MEKEKEKYTISEEETSKEIAKNYFSKIWKDSVFSNVIASGILLFFTLLAIVIGQIINVTTAEEFIAYFFKIEIKLCILIITAIIITLGYYTYLKFFKKKDDISNEYVSQNVGNYKFGDLNNILLTTYLKIPPVLWAEIGYKELDLLTLFKITIPLYSSGIDWNSPNDDSGFLYYQLGPILMSYGLCEKVPSLTNNTPDNINSYTIEPSLNGFKFFALLQSLERIENSEHYQKEFKKRKEESKNKDKNANHSRR